MVSSCRHFGLMQASAAAEKLKAFKFSKVFISPFLRYDTPLLCMPLLPIHEDAVWLCQLTELVECRTMQTAANCCEGLGIPPEKWTVTCAVCEVSPDLHDMGSVLNRMLVYSWQPWTSYLCLLRLLFCIAVSKSWHSRQETSQNS